MPIDYGTDFALADRFTANFGVIGPNNPLIVVYAVYRRWTTDRASVAGVRQWKGQCRDIRQLLGSRFDRAILASWEHDLAETAKVDQRVDACTVKLTAVGRVVLKLTAIITVSGVTSTLVIPIDGNFNPQVIFGQ